MGAPLQLDCWLSLLEYITLTQGALDAGPGPSTPYVHHKVYWI